MLPEQLSHLLSWPQRTVRYFRFFPHPQSDSVCIFVACCAPTYRKIWKHGCGVRAVDTENAWCRAAHRCNPSSGSTAWDDAAREKGAACALGAHTPHAHHCVTRRARAQWMTRNSKPPRALRGARAGGHTPPFARSPHAVASDFEGAVPAGLRVTSAAPRDTSPNI